MEIDKKDIRALTKVQLRDFFVVARRSVISWQPSLRMALEQRRTQF
jgi:hypothetical protein